MSECSPDCSCLPSPSEPGKTFCAFVDREKGYTRPCKASCCKNECTGRQPDVDMALRPTGNPKIRPGFMTNLPMSDKPSVKKWLAPFESSPIYMHEIVTDPGTYTSYQKNLEQYPLILDAQPPPPAEVTQFDSGPTLTFIGTMAVALALLL